MKKLFLLFLAMLALVANAQQKREFRGAWIQCVNGQFQGMGTQKMQQTLTSERRCQCHYFSGAPRVRRAL